MMTQRITGGLTIAFALLSVAGGLAYGRRMGFVSPDLSVRGTMAAIGLMLAFYGNAIPKVITVATPRARAIQRFAGWAFVLAGLAYAAIWALAPMNQAAEAASSAVAAALLGVLAYGPAKTLPAGLSPLARGDRGCRQGPRSPPRPHRARRAPCARPCP